MNGLKALKELHGKALKTYPVDQCRIWNLSFADEEFLSFAKVALPEILRAAEAGERLAMGVRYSRPTYYPVTDMTSRPMDYVEKVNGAWIRWRDEQLAAYDAMVKGESIC
jgi:hypothetical protein